MMRSLRLAQSFSCVAALLSLNCGAYDPVDADDLEEFDENGLAIGAVEQAISGVLVERVRRCRNSLPLPCNGITNSNYLQWETNKVAEEKQKRTYITRISDPARFSTDFLAFIAAGQQFDGREWDATVGGNSSGLTGQPSGFKNHYSATSGSATFTLNASLARTFITERWFQLDRTFLASAWDARFNHGFTASNKQEIVNAYTSWLENEINAQQLRMVYLAGHSRGGCLVMRVAQQLNRKYPDLPIIVHSFDGVCKESQNELGTYNRVIDNPTSTNPSYWAWATDVNALFTNPQALSILHLAGGEPVVFDDIGVSTLAISVGSNESSPAECRGRDKAGGTSDMEGSRGAREMGKRAGPPPISTTSALVKQSLGSRAVVVAALAMWALEAIHCAATTWVERCAPQPALEARTTM